MKNIKLTFKNSIKFVITLFYLLSSIWASYLIFNYMLSTGNSIDNNKLENMSLIILYSIMLSALAIFLLGMLSIFTNFVFVKLIYGDEIRMAAYNLLKNKKKEVSTENTLPNMTESIG